MVIIGCKTRGMTEQSILSGGLPRASVLLAVITVTERHKGPLKAIFMKHSGVASSVPLKDKRMTLEQLMTFARSFQLCPGLLPRLEVLQIFQCSLTTQRDGCPESERSWTYCFGGNMAKQKGSFGSLTYEDFLLWLATTAGVVFSGNIRLDDNQRHAPLVHLFS